MSIFIRPEINISRVLREDVQSADDLARIAFEALDQCSYRFHKAGDDEKQKLVAAARTQLIATLSTLWK